ncbi:MAG: hypothetical protein WBJ33_03965 [Candidatus Nanopelagicales bacterium]
MANIYQDSTVTLTDSQLTLPRYYFPLGAKKAIPLSEVVGVTEFDMTWFWGKLRIWGTTNPKYWMPLDLGRPKKSVGFIVNVGGRISPAFSPDQPEEFRNCLLSLGIAVPHRST